MQRVAEARSHQKRLDAQRAAGEVELQKEIEQLRESLVQQAKVSAACGAATDTLAPIARTAPSCNASLRMGKRPPRRTTYSHRFRLMAGAPHSRRVRFAVCLRRAN